MKTLLTTVFLLILGLGSSISVSAQELAPGQTLMAAHYVSENYAALSSAAGFPLLGGDAGTAQSNSPANSAGGDNQYDSGRIARGAVPLPATGLGTAPILPRTMAGDTANNSVLYTPIPSGQYSYGFGKTDAGGGRGQRNPGSAYEGRLPPTSTSSVDFDIVER